MTHVCAYACVFMSVYVHTLVVSLSFSSSPSLSLSIAPLYDISRTLPSKYNEIYFPNFINQLVAFVCWCFLLVLLLALSPTFLLFSLSSLPSVRTLLHHCLSHTLSFCLSCTHSHALHRNDRRHGRRRGRRKKS